VDVVINHANVFASAKMQNNFVKLLNSQGFKRQLLINPENNIGSLP